METTTTYSVWLSAKDIKPHFWDGFKWHKAFQEPVEPKHWVDLEEAKTAYKAADDDLRKIWSHPMTREQGYTVSLRAHYKDTFPNEDFNIRCVSLASYTLELV